MTRAGNQQARSCIRASLLGLALSFCGFSAAQETTLQASIDQVNNAIQILDDKATACLSSQNIGADSQAGCDDFLSAVDGELMASYLRHCSSLKSWRDDFVAESANSNSPIENSAAMLELLVAVEYGCGQNALQRRTQNVFPAFALLQQGDNTQVDAALVRRLAEMKFEATENRGRQSLQNSVQQQQLRSQQEIQRQNDSLENELIRQQIRNSNPLN